MPGCFPADHRARRSWPVWTMILAWLPALLVLSGRMYVRPETLSLLYLAIYVAVVCRWDRFPVLTWLLPLVQLAWVNTHGLFVLGPIVLVFALVDAALRRGALAPEHIRWWQTVVPACVATGLACLLNPYGLRGAIYPLELARTMSNPIFSRSIAELTPIPLFIEKSGLANLPLQLHLATMLLGALSFLVPIGWLIAVRLRRPEADSGAADKPGAAPVPENSRRSSAARKSSRSSRAGRKKRGAALDLDGGEGSWRISPFRLLMYAAFSLLSLQATRNSHQFAAVVGSVTAWNFAEWVAARHQLAAARDPARLVSSGLKPRLATLIAVAVLLLWVGAGQFYAQTGEGRTIGWGEEPLWFPHEAAKFAGTAGMPDRFLSYHNAHASVFEYYHSPERENGPGRTVFTDPRLEIAGAELFDEYQKLGKNIAADQPGWEDELNRLGRPSILVDHVDNAGIGASLLASRHWKCVWFDPIVAVFLHDSYAPVKTHTIDFGARHFRPDPATEPHGLAELLAAAKGVRNYLSFAIGRGDAARPLVWLAQDYARRIVETNPNSLEGWKTLGQIELLRDPPAQPAPRFRLPFDPVFDLPLVRATHAFRRAVDLSPRDFMALLGLEQVFEARQMDEAELHVLDRLVEVQPINPLQRDHLAQADASRVRIQQRLGPSPASTWKNLGELDQVVTEQLACGRPGTAAQILERAYPPEKAPWDILDRIATLHLHLGEAEKAARPLAAGVGGPPAGCPRRTARGRLLRGRPVRCGTQGLRAGPRNRSFALRGTLWPGLPRARCRPRRGCLRECPSRDRVGPQRGCPFGRPRHRLGRERVRSRGGERVRSWFLTRPDFEGRLCALHRSRLWHFCRCWQALGPRPRQRASRCKASGSGDRSQVPEAGRGPFLNLKPSFPIKRRRWPFSWPASHERSSSRCEATSVPRR